MRVACTIRVVIAAACCVLPPGTAAEAKEPFTSKPKAIEVLHSLHQICDALSRWLPARDEVLTRIRARGVTVERKYFIRFEWPGTSFTQGFIAPFFQAELHPEVAAFAKRIADRTPSQWWFVDGLALEETRRPTVGALAQALGGAHLYMPATAGVDGWSLWFSWAVPGKDRGRCFIEAKAEKGTPDLDAAGVLGFQNIAIVPYSEAEFAKLASLSAYTPRAIQPQGAGR